MLVGRGPEQQRIAALVTGARLRQSGVLVISGEAGIGKTALLDDTARTAGEMQVLRASGSEFEAGLGFSGLHQLLLPALGLLDHLPEQLREALTVALMMRSGPPPERFAVGVAALSLLSRCAEDRPLLLLVDDAHLLDPATAETLRFVARRLVADPIALLVSLRPEPDAILYSTGLPTLELTGLDVAAATTLIASSGQGAGPERAAALHHATAGNPLALLELSRDLDTVGRLPPELPQRVPEAIARSFGGRVSSLSESARMVLLIASVADGDLITTARAAAELGCAVAELADAEAIGLLQLAGVRAVFRHPLVRPAIYASAAPAHRRDVHRAVAAALPESSADLRAWHLSQACVGPDDDVADALVAVADGARARGAHGVVVTALNRAAELTSQDSRRATRLISAGQSAWLAGQPRQADALLERATALASDRATLGEIAEVRGNLALRTGSLDAGRELLLRAAELSEPADPDAAVMRLSDLIILCFYQCDITGSLAAADRAERLLGDCGTAVARVRGQMTIGMALVLAGRAGVPLIRSAVDALTAGLDLPEDPLRPHWQVIGTLFLRESGAGRDLIRRAVLDDRARMALGALPTLLFHTARDDATTDRWASSMTSYDESISLARETGLTTDLAASLAGLAWLQARMGRVAACQANADEALILAERHGITLGRLWGLFALGDLYLGQGDTEAAADSLQRLQTTLHEIEFLDVDLAPGPELAEAQLRNGDAAAAAATAQGYFARARAKGQPWALARAHRAIALTCPEPTERISLFERALELHSGSLDLFEEARTRLAYGAALRRSRSRVAARPQLRLALDAFERLGARPWADLAATELDATGAKVRRGSEGYLGVLTSQEIRIARMLGDGRTTKETAAALFLSPKTVEYHLRHVYQKLHVSSRDELRAAMTVAASDR
jgi:DNA-binding CsgD family transcriptional regulator/tetratricopeptide (TPR) repeat protein